MTTTTESTTVVDQYEIDLRNEVRRLESIASEMNNRWKNAKKPEVESGSIYELMRLEGQQASLAAQEARYALQRYLDQKEGKVVPDVEPRPSWGTRMKVRIKRWWNALTLRFRSRREIAKLRLSTRLAQYEGQKGFWAAVNRVRVRATVWTQYGLSMPFLVLAAAWSGIFNTLGGILPWLLNADETTPGIRGNLARGWHATFAFVGDLGANLVRLAFDVVAYAIELLFWLLAGATMVLVSPVILIQALGQAMTNRRLAKATQKGEPIRVDRMPTSGREAPKTYGPTPASAAV